MPNPDTVYLTAAIDGAGTYRLTGDRGTAPDISLMPMGGPAPAGIKTYPAIDLHGFEVDADNRLDLVLSPQRPDGYSGQWCEIAPDVRSLMLRSVSDDWGQHRDPVLAITRLDSPSRRQRPTPDALATSLAGLVPMVEGTLAFGMRKVAALRAGGFVNTVATVDYSAGGGLAGQWYHEGVFEVPDGRALVVEADLRGGVSTLSLALTDTLGCTLDWANAQMRREEVAAIPIAELDLEPGGNADDAVWTLPGSRTKRGNALRVPLSSLAIALINEALAAPERPKDSPFVFSMTGDTSVSGYAKAKRRLDRIIRERREKAAKEARREPVEMEHWTIHDLRTTFSTLACEVLGADISVVDRILNHVPTATTSKIMRVYNKSELFEPRKRVLRQWAELIEGLATKPQ